MSVIRVVVDGTTVMDSDPGAWSTTPPDLEQLKLMAGGDDPQPWLLPINLAIARYATQALAGRSIPAPLTSWSMTYTETADGVTVDVTTASQG